jgi:tRNA (cmo5U34)-methyltransferase
MVALLPAEAGERFSAVDLACGGGSLSEAVLRRFPECRVLALDGSPVMLRHAEARLRPYADRVEFALFDLRGREWLDRIPDDVRCVLSSLAIHHLDDEEKRRLFHDLADRLPAGGALLILDLVNPVNELAWAAYGDAWDAIVRRQSLEETGGLGAYTYFSEHWNHYRGPDLESDRPSGLYEQLRWLEDAGFSQMDCFWLRAGHALYGGYR